jgi:hypothetical protein
MNISAPAIAQARARAWPILLAAPVIKTIFLSKGNSLIMLGAFYHFLSTDIYSNYLAWWVLILVFVKFVLVPCLLFLKPTILDSWLCYSFVQSNVLGPVVCPDADAPVLSALTKIQATPVTEGSTKRKRR